MNKRATYRVMFKDDWTRQIYTVMVCDECVESYRVDSLTISIVPIEPEAECFECSTQLDQES